MAEGMQAGRLEVPVVADLDGFVRELRTKIETATEGLKAKVKVKVDDRNLKKQLKKSVEKAAAGVTAKIKVKVDRDSLRDELGEAARRAGDADVTVPVRPDGDGDPGGGLLGRLRGLLAGAQGEADRNPLQVPVRMRIPRGRGLFRMLGLGALVSLVQPAVAGIVQLGAGLTALTSAAAPAVGVVGALPGLLGAAGFAAGATAIAFSGFGAALQEAAKYAKMNADGTKLTAKQQKAMKETLDSLAPSAQTAITNILGIRDAWTETRKSVQERFFAPFVEELKPAAGSLLPLLEKGLGGVATQMGNLADRGLKAVQTGAFKRDFGIFAKSNGVVVEHLGDSIAHLSATLGHFTIAAGPFTERIAAATEGWTKWLRAATASGRADGSIDRFLQRAGDKAQQLGRATVDLGHGLASMGRAARESGESLLSGLVYQMDRFDRWAASDRGQKKMKAFFDASLPAYREMIGLIGDVGKGLGRMAVDPSLVATLRQVRYELLPGVGRFLDQIGRSVGPALISAIAAVADSLAQLSAAGLGLGLIINVFADFLWSVNQLLHAVPGLATGIGALLGVMLALRVVRSVAGWMGGFASSVQRVASGSRLAAGAMGPQLSLAQRMGLAYRTAAGQAGGFTGALRGMGAVAGTVGIRGSLGSLSGFLGGPWGIALMAGAAGLSWFASRQRAAAEAARQHQTEVKTLAQALIDSNGVIDANVRATTAKMLMDNGLAKTADKVGIGIKELTAAALEQDGSFAQLEKRLRQYGESQTQVVYRGNSAHKELTERGRQFVAAADAIAAKKDVFTEYRTEYEAMRDVLGEPVATTRFERLEAAVTGLSDTTADAESRAKSLKDALEALAGTDLDFHEAQTKVNELILDIEDRIREGVELPKDWIKGDKLTLDGLVDTSSRAGQELNEQITALRDAAVAAVTAAEQAGKSPAEALKIGQQELVKSRDAALKLADAYGLSKEEARRLVNQMGLMPENVGVLFETKGMSKVGADLLRIQTELAGLEEGKTITVKAPSDEAIKALRSVGVEIKKTPDGKKVEITAPTGPAQTAMRALTKEILNTPSDKKVNVKAIVKQTLADLATVQEKIRTTKGKSFTMKALTTTATESLRALGYKVKTMPNGTVKVTVPTGTASSQVDAIQNMIWGLKDRSVTISIFEKTYKKTYGPYADGYRFGNAIGRVVDYFANGGIRQHVRPNGGARENHVAQIAPAGSIRVWGERETGGEAYVPLGESKRGRSKAIVEEVVRRFNGAVAWYADGGITGRASALYQSARMASLKERGAAPAGPAPLVGGDLNLNMGEARDPGRALQDAMFELRHIRQGGGAHA